MMKKIIVGFIGLILFVASAGAASSVLEGIVKDAKGYPIEGADYSDRNEKWWEIAHNR